MISGEKDPPTPRLKKQQKTAHQKKTVVQAPSSAAVSTGKGEWLLVIKTAEKNNQKTARQKKWLLVCTVSVFFSAVCS